MSLQILKFPIYGMPTHQLFIPAGAKILSVQIQHDTPTIWALCDNSSAWIYRDVRTFMTGESIPGDLRGYSHVGSILSHEGSYVRHIFVQDEICMGECQ